MANQANDGCLLALGNIVIGGVVSNGSNNGYSISTVTGVWIPVTLGWALVLEGGVTIGCEALVWGEYWSPASLVAAGS